jgi:hypothetical protein
VPNNHMPLTRLDEPHQAASLSHLPQSHANGSPAGIIQYLGYPRAPVPPARKLHHKLSKHLSSADLEELCTSRTACTNLGQHPTTAQGNRCLTHAGNSPLPRHELALRLKRHH